ncbi:M23 family metallopeptidase [Limnohabitans lacus]|uniref:M23 family metallopeptidase n=1 Tax=Limnohabitans lacus TaxID=3045173 RepID=A0ABT6X799_9BURK|nr:M23 family metallopeptidase [Limnohabitans sp. HM2-2]MDI9233883.1 M23 family metallopeptidase [Limnohabitans sp. HM2-2]
MQLIWVSGPTARVVAVSITARKVLLSVAAVAMTLLLLGSLFHLIGLRVAVEYAPELAHRMGGVTSQAEQMKIEAHYRARLEGLHGQISSVTGLLRDIDQQRKSFLSRFGIESLVPGSVRSKAEATDGRGGPLKAVPIGPSHPADLHSELAFAAQQIQQLEETLITKQAQWQRDLDRVSKLPTALPLAQDFSITSGFGVRADPMTHQPSMHEGIDFVAPVGTPVLATADGKVLRSGFSGAYGEMVDVLHADGFVSRYAHLSRRHVNEGDKVERGQLLGLLGNTGRSTGPHLHYEVMYQGQAMHPAKAFAAWARLNLKP